MLFLLFWCMLFMFMLFWCMLFMLFEYMDMLFLLCMSLMLDAIWLFMCLSLDIMLFPWFLPACCIIMLLLDIMLLLYICLSTPADMRCLPDIMLSKPFI